jgi:hypothetical protein
MVWYHFMMDDLELEGSIGDSFAVPQSLACLIFQCAPLFFFFFNLFGFSHCTFLTR